VVGVAVWVCTLESGIHATIAGVALGLLTPARPLMPEVEAGRVADRLSGDDDVTVEEVRALGFELRESVSVAERLELALHPWTSYVVIPIFALANAGIPLSTDVAGDAATSRITLGVVAGLVVGKLVGITSFAWLAVRSGLGRLPHDVSWRQVVGMAATAGIGFTVSIFVTGLAFEADALQDEAKVGVLTASALSALAGVLLLRRAPPPRRNAGKSGEPGLSTPAAG
jgi:NhaA family Na+:H+ antiporter